MPSVVFTGACVLRNGDRIMRVALEHMCADAGWSVRDKVDYGVTYLACSRTDTVKARAAAGLGVTCITYDRLMFLLGGGNADAPASVTHVSEPGFIYPLQHPTTSTVASAEEVLQRVAGLEIVLERGLYYVRRSPSMAHRPLPISLQGSFSWRDDAISAAQRYVDQYASAENAADTQIAEEKRQGRALDLDAPEGPPRITGRRAINLGDD